MSRITTAGSASLIESPLRAGGWARVADYVQLTKPRIVILELVTVVVAAHLAMPWGVDPWVLAHATLGAALIAASAGALNQWWEQKSDARMARTARRPLPTGRLSSQQVLTFGIATLIVGSFELLLFVNAATFGFALATWGVYVLAYTPLKSRSPLNTAVGAISGAIPILIGWSSTGAPLDVRAWALVAAMFLWQFPHFMAIAWLYRAEYARAGLRMLTVVDPSGLRAGAQAVVAAVALIPVSLVPALSPEASSIAVYSTWTIVLGALQAAAAARFFCSRNERTARWLLRATLVYLPCWMGLLLIVAV